MIYWDIKKPGSTGKVNTHLTDLLTKLFGYAMFVSLGFTGRATRFPKPEIIVHLNIIKKSDHK